MRYETLESYIEGRDNYINFTNAEVKNKETLKKLSEISKMRFRERLTMPFEVSKAHSKEGRATQTKLSNESIVLLSIRTI